MPGIIGNGVSVRGIVFNQFDITFNISGTVVAADVGKAVTLDTAAANTMKLAGDGDTIYGILRSYENRVQEGIKVGTVSMKFSEKLSYTGTIPPIGTQVVGGTTPGYVKTVTVALGTGISRVPATVVEQDATNGTVTVMMI